MIKAMALIKRKSGLSREEFAKHYEEVHALLARKHLPTLRVYRRNHVLTPNLNSLNISAACSELDFDCITEWTFDDMEGYQAFIDFLAAESSGEGDEAGKEICADENFLIDRSQTIFFLVDEKVS